MSGKKRNSAVAFEEDEEAERGHRQQEREKEMPRENLLSGVEGNDIGAKNGMPFEEVASSVSSVVDIAALLPAGEVQPKAPPASILPSTFFPSTDSNGETEHLKEEWKNLTVAERKRREKEFFRKRQKQAANMLKPSTDDPFYLQKMAKIKLVNESWTQSKLCKALGIGFRVSVAG